LSERPPFRLFALDPDSQRLLDRVYEEDRFYLPSEGVLPSSIQGFALCRAGDRTPVIGFHSFPYVYKRGWRRERILRVTRPLPFSRTDLPTEKALVRFMQEIIELGRRTDAHQIEIEMYREIRSRIFFPSTNCAVHTYNQPEWVGLFEKAGFACRRKTLCFEMGLRSLVEEKDRDVLIRPCRPGAEEDRKGYYETWIRGGECPYDLARTDFWYVNAFGWPRLWYTETPSVLTREDYILFAERDGEILGMIHWWPNVYPLLREKGRKAVFLPEPRASEALSAIREGKIFKIAVSDRAGKSRDRIVRSLIEESMRLMKHKHHLETCQIGNIPSENELLIEHLCKIGAKLVHEVWLQQKRVS
jgi:hypothetical protein